MYNELKASASFLPRTPHSHQSQLASFLPSPSRCIFLSAKLKGKSHPHISLYSDEKGEVKKKVEKKLLVLTVSMFCVSCFGFYLLCSLARLSSHKLCDITAIGH